MDATEQLRFDGITAIVTGAGGGLGRAHAMLLAARGAKVVVADVSDRADDVAAEITELGGIAVCCVASVADAADVERIVATAREAFGPVDVVVNNAGISRPEPISRLTVENLHDELSVHLVGSALMTRAVWSDLRASEHGAVVNTTSGVGLFGLAGAMSYSAAKMAIVGMTNTLALEGARHGIRVNAVAPIARTAMAGEVFGDLTPVLDPELVSAVVAWLVHPACNMTREVISCGGGRVARVIIEVGAGAYAAGLSPEDVRELMPAVMGQATGPMSDAMAEVELIRKFRDSP